MRIQHNIMAMNAYRNYNTNTSALSKNLEKLSSGYKINRAGDDAAGLAISEKMRAQITGLETAQKNGLRRPGQPSRPAEPPGRAHHHQRLALVFAVFALRLLQ